jgi:alkylation response protein AidB-like acyl-CoA dehydrogenase
MDLQFGPEDEAFRGEVRAWLAEHLVGDFAALRGRGGPGDLDGALEGRKAWERLLAAGRWTCLAWPEERGGRALSLHQEVIFHEEYARAGAPGRLGHLGETLLGPTILAFGTDEQQRRFLPPIVRAEQLWCQGYSEPGAGSDLANVQTRAVRDGGEWVVTGQKVWTSLAGISDGCFAIVRTEPGTARHDGLSILLIPMRQPGVTVVPIRQMTGSTEFAEVFFDGARAPVDHVIGPVNGGWKVAMATLAFERGASTLAQQLAFVGELEAVVARAKATGAASDPLVRDRIADLAVRLRVLRCNALRVLSPPPLGVPPRAALVLKLYWATWHRDLGELAMDVLREGGLSLGPEGALDPLQRLFLWTRADTIYAGTNQIQRTLIAERALGLPR